MSAADKPELDRAEVPSPRPRVHHPRLRRGAHVQLLRQRVHHRQIPAVPGVPRLQQLAEAGAEAGAMSAELVEIATRAFRLACDNKTSKLCDPALEGLRLLFATGLSRAPPRGGRQRLCAATLPPSHHHRYHPRPDAVVRRPRSERALSSLVGSVAAREVRSPRTRVACPRGARV